MIQLIIADDHPIVRSGIKSILSTEKSFNIIDEAVNGEDAYDKIITKNPNVAVIDMSMPKMNGIELLNKLKKNKIKNNVIILSNYDDKEYIIESIKAGAKAYLLKDVELEILTETIKRVSNGDSYYSQRVSKILADHISNDTKIAKLTKMELKVIKEIALGNNSFLIAKNLDVGKRTIDTHRYRIMKKFNTHNSIELLKIAKKNRII